MKISVWSLTCRQLAYLSHITVANISESFTHKMAAKTSWRRYGTKLRHCHPMYSVTGAHRSVQAFLHNSCSLPTNTQTYRPHATTVTVGRMHIMLRIAMGNNNSRPVGRVGGGVGCVRTPPPISKMQNKIIYYNWKVTLAFHEWRSFIVNNWLES